MATPRRLLSGLAAAAVLLAGSVAASAQRGDLCFPLEGWAIVARWHVGSAARSVREGWARRLYHDRGWARVAGGAPLPRGGAGTWLRTTFRYRRGSWTDARLVAPENWPAGARLFLNGVAEPLEAGAPSSWLGSLVRNGINAVAIHVPPPPDPAGTAGTIPVVEVRGMGRASGAEKNVARLSAWRTRPEELAPALPAAWIKGGAGGDAPGAAATLPSAADAALLRAPVGIRAVLDVPAYWRTRTISLLLHEVPGTPAVYLNGEKVADALQTPARIDLGHLFRFDGRDTVALVWADGPADMASGWGIAAVHWSAGIAPPDLPAHGVIGWDPALGASQPGARQALAFASQVLAVSTTMYTLEWTGSGAGTAGTLVAAWSGTSFRGADLAAVRDAVPGVVAAAGNPAPPSVVRRPVWLMTPPTVGHDRRAGVNSRLLDHDKLLVTVARAAGARPVPVFEVFNSVLRRQRLWPARPEWTDVNGTLSPHGSYLAGLVLLDALSQH